MPTTATGILATPIEALRRLVSESTTFQEWVGADDATEALARVYAIEIDAENWVRPYCRIGPQDELNVVWGGYANGNLVLEFYGDTAEEFRFGGASASDYASAHYEFSNVVGAIVSEIMQASLGAAGTDGQLVIRSIPMVVPPQRPIEQTDGGQTTADYHWCRFGVNYGPDLSQLG